MKNLILMRHAKAANAVGLQSDFDRTLADRGVNDAGEMGSRLLNKKVVINLIVCSAAKRTTQTARILADKLGYSQTEILSEFDLYNCTTEEGIDVIRHLNDKYDTVLLVGHNPAVTSLVSYLSNSFIESMPTSTQASIVFNATTWKQIAPNLGSLSWIDTPKKINLEK